MQMGYTRAGLYGFDLFQSVGSPSRMQGTNRILPQFQDFTVGDDVPVSPVANMVFESIEPNETSCGAGKRRAPSRGRCTRWMLRRRGW